MQSSGRCQMTRSETWPHCVQSSGTSTVELSGFEGGSVNNEVRHRFRLTVPPRDVVRVGIATGALTRSNQARFANKGISWAEVCARK